FFFQAEDGIRDRNVTGVQTCALPIYNVLFPAPLCPIIPTTSPSLIVKFKCLKAQCFSFLFNLNDIPKSVAFITILLRTIVFVFAKSKLRFFFGIFGTDAR